MNEVHDQSLFIDAFSIQKGDCISIIGSGGKTSLMFRLAREGMQRGFRVLVTTSTKIFIPKPYQYTAMDLSGNCFEDDNSTITEPGVYVAGSADTNPNKIKGIDVDLFLQRKRFDLILVEADGAAQKSLKGWKASEPVIPTITTKTIGVIDIRTIGKESDESFIHRFDLFSQITGIALGENIGIEHLQRAINHPRGLFGKAIGEKFLYSNKVETDQDKRNAATMRKQIDSIHCVTGSLKTGTIYE